MAAAVILTRVALTSSAPPTSACNMQERILLCDRDTLTIASISASLRDAGYAVSEATTVDQCLLLAGAGRHDLALIDVMMPPGSLEWQETKGGYASGIALARKLRQVQPDLKLRA